jgi:hypothetical protein
LILQQEAYVYESTTGRRCSECGGPINARNIIGICRRNPDCDRKNQAAKRRRKGVLPWAEHKRGCKEPGCPNPHRAKGWCGAHYQRYCTTGDPGEAELRKKPVDIKAGAVIGVWTVLEDFEKWGDYRRCRCGCGNIRLLGVGFLLRGRTGLCLCHGKGRPPGRALVAATGMPYLPAGSVSGRLTTLEDAAFSADYVRCLCECGNESKPRAYSVKSKGTQSCGCLQMEVRRTHGLSSHPLYQVWHSMVARCTNPRLREYPHYGGRGIKVCDRWLGLPDGLLNFAADMGERPEGTTLDRYPDNDGGYRPGNCQWRTPLEQNQHKRTVGPLTQERDALLARVAELEAQVDGRLF